MSASSVIGATVTSLPVFFRLNKRLFLGFLLSSLVGLGLNGTAGAVDRIGLRVGSLQGAGWSLEDIELTLGWEGGARAGYRMRIGSLRAVGLSSPVRGIEAQCQKGEVSETRLKCDEGTLNLDYPGVGKKAAGFRLLYDPVAGKASLQVEELAIAGGRVGLQMSSNGDHWTLQLKGKRLAVSDAAVQIARHVSAVGQWAVDGKLDIALHAAGTGTTIESVDWSLDFDHLAFSGPSGSYLGQGLAGRWSGEMTRTQANWTGATQLALSGGELLTPAFYVSASGAPLQVQSGILIDQVNGLLQLDALEYAHAGVVELSASAMVGLMEPIELRRLELQTRRFRAQSVYQSYFRPVLPETLLERVHWTGSAAIGLVYDQAGPSRMQLDLDQLGVEDTAVPAQPDLGIEARPSRFSVQGLDGTLIWSDGQPPELSRLRWSEGHLFEIPVGSGEIALEFDGGSMSLVEESSIPVLDGELLVDRLRVGRSDFGTGSDRIEFEGVLTPVSMEALSAALGLPLLSGKLSGVIPGVSYEQGRLELGGNLLLRIFDGEVLLRNLRVSDLLGALPILQADVEVNDIDLETLTGTFAFGKITGRLDGRIDALYMEDWAPVSFDARFATPEDDNSRHRISQRAVDNISNLGGAGVSGAVSRGFLGIFKEFGYKRLGIGCRLKQGVCEMSGVAPAEKGYYLVEGGGIPRITVIGYNRNTDWNRLIRQLSEMTTTGTPVIE